MTASRPWRGQPYLDELRPPAGRKVDLALFATYSLDLSALGAALLALTGRGDDVGSGSIADFATAVEALRGAARFLVQRGRIARPTRLPTLAGVLDQFVVEVPYDETERSWHKKAALVRYVPEGAARSGADPVWRLWVGSRNLTRGCDLEAGLLLESVARGRKGGRRVPGIGRVGALLAAEAALPGLDPDDVASTLEGACWAMPPGIEVAQMQAATKGKPFGFDSPSPTIEKVTVVSPFLDAAFVRRAAGWGGEGTSRTLVSTREALAGVASARGRPLSLFTRVLALDAPEVPLESVEEPAGGTAGTPERADERDDADPLPPSLHAKLFCFEAKGRATLLMGSANATSRAWGGRNVELLAELRGGAEIKAGLANLVGGARPVDLAELEAQGVADPRPIDELEDIRRRLAAALTPTLSRDGPTFTLHLGAAPGLPGDVSLDVGLATSEALAVPLGATSVALGDVPLSRQTDLVRFRLASAKAAVAWMQRAPVHPPLEPERDAAALSSLMGFAAFQSWMRQLLSGDATADDGPRWDQHDERTAAADRGMFDAERLTLEDIVGSWGADRNRFKRADAQFERYCDALLRQEDTVSASERAALEELRGIWRLARERLPA